MDYFESVSLSNNLRPILAEQEIECAIQDKVDIYEW
jgi:hypothetical protein